MTEFKQARRSTARPERSSGSDQSAEGKEFPFTLTESLRFISHSTGPGVPIHLEWRVSVNELAAAAADRRRQWNCETVK